MERRDSMKKKVIILSAVVVGAIALGIGGYVYAKEQHKQAVLDAMQIDFVKELTVEYGDEVDSKSFIKEMQGGTLQKIPALDTKSLGEQKLTFVLEQEGLQKEFTCMVTVRDTQPAEIKFKKNTITITEGESVDIKANIKSIRDAIDGDLRLLEGKNTLEKGTYIISGEVKTDTAGTYDIHVKAMDKNGNLSEKQFTVNVKEKPRKTISQAPSATKKSSPSGNTAMKPQVSDKDTITPTYIHGILLVNKQHPVPQDFGGGVDPTAYAALQQLRNAAAAAGYSMPLISGYRSYDYQAQLYNGYVARDGKAAADRYSAQPGKSEHQTGLAYDVGSLSNSYGETAAGKWLAAHCAEYGFILRYPQGKEHITGYMYEPWHIRYVGKDVAAAIMSSGLTLEEYLGVY